MRIKDNEEELRKLLTSFCWGIKHSRGHGHFESYEKEIDKWLGEQICYEQAYDELARYEDECARINKRLFRAIKSVRGAAFVRHLREIIDGDMKNYARISREPEGEFYAQKYGRQIRGYWVRQWSVGTEGDSFAGIISVEIKPGRYFQFDYSI